jgi:hypothetical protein
MIPSDTRAGPLHASFTRAGERFTRAGERFTRAGERCTVAEMKKPAKKPRVLPAALVANAEELARGKRERLLREGRELVALVKRRVRGIAEAFYDIGDALLRLSAPDVLAALGYGSIHALSAAELGLSERQVTELVEIRRRLTREQAIRLGTQGRAAAYLELADATPARDTASGLARRKVTTPGGLVLEPGAGTRKIERAAKEFRHAQPRKTRRGNTTSPEERAIAAAIQAKLEAQGVTARVQALATKPGQPAKLRIEMPIDRAAALRRAAPAR